MGPPSRRTAEPQAKVLLQLPMAGHRASESPGMGPPAMRLFGHGRILEARGGAVWDLYHDRQRDRWHMERLWD